MEIPSKKEQPYSYDKWKRLDILKASNIERVLMLRLYGLVSTSLWLFGKNGMDWDTKDMREFVRDVAKEIEAL